MTKTPPGIQHSQPFSSAALLYAGQSHAIKVDHHIFSAGEWQRARFLEHPTMKLTLSVRTNDYESFSVKRPNIGSMTILAKLDTCAQSCLWSLNECLDVGFSRHDLIPVNFTCCQQVTHRGFLQDGTKVSCATMVYVSPSAHGFFLSLEAMLDLCLVNLGFPLCPSEQHAKDLERVQAASIHNDFVEHSETGGDYTWQLLLPNSFF